MHSPIFSLEVFPPKRTSPVGTIYDTLDGLQGLDPDFISVTYGTGKSSDRTLTARIAHTVNEYGIPAVAHLTAQYLDKDDVDEALDLFDQAKVSGVLALRAIWRPTSARSVRISRSTAPAIRKSTRRRPRLRRISTISRRRSTRA